MQLSLKSFIELDSSKQKVLILGDMNELGEDAVKMHQEILECFKYLSFKSVFLIGKYFAQADSDKQYKCFDSCELCIEYLDQNPNFTFDNTISLIKASRSLKLEEISDYILAKSKP